MGRMTRIAEYSASVHESYFIPINGHQLLPTSGLPSHNFSHLYQRVIWYIEQTCDCDCVYLRIYDSVNIFPENAAEQMQHRNGNKHSEEKDEEATSHNFDDSTPGRTNKDG